MFHGQIKHFETRPSKTSGGSLDLLVRLDIEQKGLLNLIKSIRQERNLSVSIMADEMMFLKGKGFINMHPRRKTYYRNRDIAHGTNFRLHFKL